MKQLVNELHPVGTILGATATNLAKAKTAKLAQTKLKKPLKNVQGQQSTTGAVNTQQKVQGVGRNPNLQLNHNESTLLQSEVLWEIKKIHALNEKKKKKKSPAGKVPGIDADAAKTPNKGEEKPEKLEPAKVNTEHPRVKGRGKVSQQARDAEAKKLKQGRLSTRRTSSSSSGGSAAIKQAKERGKLKRVEDIARRGGRTAIGVKAAGKVAGKAAKLGIKGAAALGGGALVGAGYAAKGAGQAAGGIAKGAGHAVGGVAKGAGHAVGGTSRLAGDIVKGTGDTLKGAGEVAKGVSQGAGKAVGGVAKGTLGASRGLAGRAAGGIKKVGSTFARAAYRGGRYH